MILYIKNPKESTPKLLELISEFSKVQDTKLIHRNLLHSYTLTMNQQKEKQGKPIPFTIATKRIKYLGINLTTEVKDLYPENYKTLLREIKEHTIE